MEQLAEPDDDRDVHAGDEDHQRAVGHRPTDDPIDLIQPVPHDRDADGQWNQHEADRVDQQEGAILGAERGDRDVADEDGDVEDDRDGDPACLSALDRVAVALPDDQPRCRQIAEEEEHEGSDSDEVEDGAGDRVVDEGMRIGLGLREGLRSGEQRCDRHHRRHDGAPPEELPVERRARLALGEQQPDGCDEPDGRRAEDRDDERHPGGRIEMPRLVEGFGRDDAGADHTPDRSVCDERQADQVAGPANGDESADGHVCAEGRERRDFVAARLHEDDEDPRDVQADSGEQ